MGAISQKTQIVNLSLISCGDAPSPSAYFPKILKIFIQIGMRYPVECEADFPWLINRFISKMVSKRMDPKIFGHST
jgi:hypothetical protein